LDVVGLSDAFFPVIKHIIVHLMVYTSLMYATDIRKQKIAHELQQPSRRKIAKSAQKGFAVAMIVGGIAYLQVR
jgi:hypothetical protein